MFKLFTCLLFLVLSVSALDAKYEISYLAPELPNAKLTLTKNFLTTGAHYSMSPDSVISRNTASYIAVESVESFRSQWIYSSPHSTANITSSVSRSRWGLSCDSSFDMELFIRSKVPLMSLVLKNSATTPISAIRVPINDEDETVIFEVVISNENSQTAFVDSNETGDDLLEYFSGKLAPKGQMVASFNPKELIDDELYFKIGDQSIKIDWVVLSNAVTFRTESNGLKISLEVRSDFYSSLSFYYIYLTFL
ncbi:hypothetical protein RCL1_005807 [Eukaryota sp. TZLM3-RCL]